MTRGQAAEAKMHEAQDFLDNFSADPSAYGQCSVYIDMEDCVFDISDEAKHAGQVEITEDVVVGVEKLFLAGGATGESVDPLLAMMESMSDDDGCDADGAFTAAAAELLQQYSEYDAVMNMDPISDVGSDSE